MVILILLTGNRSRRVRRNQAALPMGAGTGCFASFHPDSCTDAAKNSFPGKDTEGSVDMKQQNLLKMGSLKTLASSGAAVTEQSESLSKPSHR